MCKRYDSGYPRPKIFDVPGQDENVFSKLLTFDLESRNSIIQVYDDIKDRLPNKVYPFGKDSFGNHLCFDYRSNPESPTVVFWDHEEETWKKQYILFAQHLQNCLLVYVILKKKIEGTKNGLEF